MKFLHKPLASSSEKIASNESGQILLIGLFVVVGLSMVAVSVANVGMMVAEKMQVQDAVDAAAYSAAVAEARYMNLSAYINRAMIANYNAMAFNTALWAFTASWDHGLAVVVGMLYLLAGILQFIPVLNAAAPAVDSGGAGVDAVHRLFHTFNRTLDGWFSQDDGRDINSYIEMYNTDLLSMYQGLSYVAMQASRHEIIQRVASRNDPEVITTTVVGLGAEAVSADELAQSIDYIAKEAEDDDERSSPFSDLNDIFNAVTEDSGMSANEQEIMLAALTEASLDKFTAGRYRDENRMDLMRNLDLGNILRELIGSFARDAIDIYLEAECVAGCVFGGFLTGGCSCGRNPSMRIGSQQVWGFENSSSANRVPIIARRRMRQVNDFAIGVGDLPGNFLFDIGRELLEGIIGQGVGGSNGGYSSGERHNDIRVFTNLFDPSRAFACGLTGCSMNQWNALFGLLSGSIVGVATGDVIDEHWDGSYSAVPTCAVRYYNAQFATCDDFFDYIGDVASDGPEMGVPKYDWKTDLPYVGFPTYHYDPLEQEIRPVGTSRFTLASDGTDDLNVFHGPSVAVVGVKRREDINGLSGLGMGNEYNISALSRAQVYYLRNPNRPDELPNLFNPHWVARLAPLDNDATPPLLREGLSFISGMGVPLVPTH